MRRRILLLHHVAARGHANHLRLLHARLLPERGHPALPRRHVALRVLVVAQRQRRQIRTHLAQTLVQLLRSHVVVREAAVAQTEHPHLHALQQVRGTLLAQRSEEHARILRQLAVAARRAQHHHVLLVRQLVHLHLVQLAHRHVHAARLRVLHQRVRQLLRVVRLRTVQHRQLERVARAHSAQLARRHCTTHEVVVTLLQMRLQRSVQTVRQLRMRAVQLQETTLVRQEVLQVVAQILLVVQLERVLALRAQTRVVAVQRPVAALHRQLHLLVRRTHRGNHILHQTRAVAEDDRRTVVCLRLVERLDRLRHIRVQSHRRHVHVAVRHRHQTHLLLVRQLTASSELLHCRHRGSLRLLASRVRVHFRIQNHDVHILARRQHVVHTSVTDIVRPTVSSNDPLTDLLEQIALGSNLRQSRTHLLQSLQHVHDLVRHRLATTTVAEVLQPLTEQIRQLARKRLSRLQNRLHQTLQHTTTLRHRHRHAQTVLGVVLEQRVRPCRSLTTRVVRVRVERSRSSPDRRATRRVRNVHALTEQLRDQLHVRRLSASVARSAELQQRLVELHRTHVVATHQIALVRNRHRVLPVATLLLLHLLEVLHHQRLVSARLHAQLASRAIHRRHLDAETQIAQRTAARRLQRLEALRSLLRLLLRQQDRTNARVRTYRRTLVALNALVDLPLGIHHRNTTLLVLRRSRRHHATGSERRHGQRVALVAHDRQHHLVHELGSTLQHVRLLHRRIHPLLARIVDLDHRLQRVVQTVPVVVDNVLALLDVRLLDHLLHDRKHLLHRHAVRQLEVHDTHRRVHVLAQVELAGQRRGVHHEEAGVLASQDALRLAGQQLVDLLLGGGGGVQQEDAVVLQRGEHVELVQVAALGARHVVGAADVVRAVDGVLAVAQVVHGPAVGFLRLVLGVALHVQVVVVAQDLHDGLRHGHRAVGAHAPHDRLVDALRHRVGLGQLRQRAVGDIVVDAHGEALDGLVRAQVLEHRAHLAGREVLGAHAVAAADDHRVHVAGGVHEGGAHVQVQRLARAGAVLAAVQHGDALHGLGQHGEEVLHAPGSEQTHLQHAHLAAAGVQVVHRLVHHVGAGAHADHDVLRVLRAVVLERAVAAAEHGRHLLEDLVHEVRHGRVGGVGGLHQLHVDVGRLGRAAQVGVVGVDGAIAVALHGVPGHELLERLLVDGADVAGLVRSAETVEEVHKRQASTKGSNMRA